MLSRPIESSNQHEVTMGNHKKKTLKKSENKFALSKITINIYIHIHPTVALLAVWLSSASPAVVLHITDQGGHQLVTELRLAAHLRQGHTASLAWEIPYEWMLLICSNMF